MDDVREKLIATVTQSSRLQATTAWLCLAVVLACARYDAQASDSLVADSATRAVRDSLNRAQPGYVVDSIFSTAEELRRFTVGLEHTDSLTGGAATPRQLVRLFTVSLARRDTAALRSLVVSRAEFGYVVFPESPYTRPPYKTKPLVIWTQLASESARGLSRLLDRIAADAASISDMRCGARPQIEGHNRYWRQCSVLLHRVDGTAVRSYLFGSMIQRGARTKFLSYATDF